MAKAKDIRFDNETNDLFIDPVTGDFAITESDTRHVNDLIESFAGWWKEFPAVGVGIRRSSATSGSKQRVSRDVKIQMIADGYKVTGIQFDKEGKIFVTGNRNNVNL
tara:strand:+ start:2114 stop:2434 length:321 start_codon:yes stop_codon:yes gene_type:complete